MKRNLIALLLLLIATCLWAQDNNISTDDEKQRIPINPIIIDGEVTGVPDGTPVKFAFRKKKSTTYWYDMKLWVDTIRNGRFHIEKKFIYKDQMDSEDNIQYCIAIPPMPFMDIYAYPGAKIKVTGNGKDPSFWNAESNHPWQKERDELMNGLYKKLASVRQKIQEEYEADDVDEELIEKLEREKPSIHANHILDFLKDKEYNDFFITELNHAALSAYLLKDSLLKVRILNFMNEKFPVDYDRNDEYIAEIKQYTISASNQLKYGDKMPDFTLYDREDKEHKLSEFVGKKIVLLQFSTASCGPCQAIKPKVEEFYAKHKDKVEIISISCDYEEIWKKEKKVSWHDWNDHALAASIKAKFDMPGYPFYVIISSNGTIGSTFLGTDKLQKYFNSF